MRCISVTWLALLALSAGCFWDNQLPNDGGDGDAADSHDAYDAGEDGLQDGTAGDADAGGDDAGIPDGGCVPGDVPMYPDADPSKFPPGLSAGYIQGLASIDVVIIQAISQHELRNSRT